MRGGASHPLRPKSSQTTKEPHPPLEPPKIHNPGAGTRCRPASCGAALRRQVRPCGARQPSTLPCPRFFSRTREPSQARTARQELHYSYSGHSGTSAAAEKSWCKSTATTGTAANTGESRVPSLCDSLKEILWLCLSMNITLQLTTDLDPSKGENGGG